MHLDQATLQAYMDAELPPAEQAEADRHLQGCPECRAQLADFRQQAAALSHTLGVLDPDAAQNPISPQSAFLRLQHRISTQPKEQITMWQKLSRRSLRPAWIILTVLVVFSALMFIPQVRAAAVNLLGIFRVQNIQVVQFNPANLPQDLDQQMVKVEDLLQDQFKFEDMADPVELASLDEARQQVDFPVLDAAGYTGNKAYTYQSGATAEFTIDVDLMQLVLNELGSDLVLPKAIDGQKVSLTVPASITTLMGNCPRNAREYDPDTNYSLSACTSLVQMPSPTITTPPGLDPAEVGKAMLGVLGFSDAEAAEISQRVDWTSTLLVPLPEDMNYREVTVRGVPGTLVVEDDYSYNRAPRYTLLWTEGGMLYGLSGRGTTRNALAIANSLQ
ncbi:MAG: anti-sigma factor family protein [Anaerolineales bacterium]|jgi:hypothetical protein